MVSQLSSMADEDEGNFQVKEIVGASRIKDHCHNLIDRSSKT